MPLCIATLLFALHCLLLTSCVVCHAGFGCTHISGALMQIDVGVGQVFGVNQDGSIFTRFGSSWTQLPGKLKHVTVGPAGVWGANRENLIFKLVGTDWVNVPGLLKQIDAGGDQFVAGANHVDAIYCLPKKNTVGYSGSNSALNWRQIPGGLKYYSCGPYSCWGVNSADHIFVRKGVNSFNCEGDGTWQEVPGSLSMIEVGSDGSVYGVNSVGDVFRRDSTSACQPEGTWQEVPGSLSMIEVGSDGSVYGVNSVGDVFRRDSTSACQPDGTWQEVPGSLSMIEVGSDGSVYGVNSVGDVFRRDSTSACQPEGTGWTNIPLYSGRVKHVSYDLGHLWLILNNDDIYDCTEH
ncbi:lectin L6-like isoform X2 [Hypomesus transpacificus]|uniref:lectin L6-like isoform X2 n=1 Tax=Hypomesus transpacificus TaxID=137520 RepID=UPI001F088643|nr:lectin L6-like isoform X2 [Hypomesus transpacificus]